VETANDWLHDEVLTGLQKLVCLSLPGTPALEIIAGTAMAWGEALEYGRVWDEARDTPRIRAAFTALLALSTDWPAPGRLLELMPSSEPPTKIAHDRGIPQTRAARLRHLSDILGGELNPEVTHRDAT
jgi:hypothetical protein